jgi:hypothetical protein
VKSRKELAGEAGAPFGRMDTEAVDYMNGLLFKESRILVANRGENSVFLFDEQDDFILWI